MVCLAPNFFANKQQIIFTSSVDVAIKDLNIRKGIIIAYVTHKGVSKVATGDMRIQLSDTVIIISKVAGLRDINDLLS